MTTTASMNLALTAGAAKKVTELLDKEGLHGQKELRVFVQGGGCAGMSYGMAFDEADEADDLVVDSNGLKVIVDMTSASYLDGVEIDYIDGLMGRASPSPTPTPKGVVLAATHSVPTAPR